ncbi:hypothetical protein [Noviherbaspirillum saxi]|uniref:Uncharacterized protein n=1 Tax=Noviherbaspirillum saxi TaxID=2320863 RepID=A0A3A3GAT7_9BURK|nr:hypothetical protein [Noviherbaspirillum saxi]RJF99305.1 hypothetical protein D3871_12830 [Noviherbaspirillum saxi]
MKLGLISALSIAVGWAILAIAQLWLQPLSAENFIKVSVTAGILVVIILVVTLAAREYLSEKKMKDDGFIDG